MPTIHKQWLSHENPIAGVINHPQVRNNRSLGYKDIRLHVSDIMKVEAAFKFCEREHVIRKLYSPSAVATALAASYDLLFDLGNALHDNARNRWMKYNKDGRKRVLARWRCFCGTTHHTGVNPDDANICKRCRFKPLVFDEYEIYSERYRIVAHPDFTVVKGKDVIETGVFDKSKHQIRIVEIKGLDRVDIEWDHLDGPLGEHVLQASLYYHLMRFEGYRVDKTISILYGERSLKRTLFRGEPWKEFQIEVSPISRVQKFFDKATNVINAVEEKVVPARSVCNSIDCPRAKNCSVAALCFGLSKDAFKKSSTPKRLKIRKRPKPIVI